MGRPRPLSLEDDLLEALINILIREFLQEQETQRTESVSSSSILEYEDKF